MSLNLQPVIPADEPFLVDLYGRSRQDELALTGWSAEQKAFFVRFQFVAQHTAYRERFPDGQFRLVLEGGAPVGRLYVGRSKDEIRILDILLMPEHRGRGLGSRLLAELIDESESTGLPLSVFVDRGSPALRFFERLGFVPVSETEIAYLMTRAPRGRSAIETS